MESFKDSLAFWSSILGTILGFLGVYESSQWLAVIGLLFIVASTSALLYAWRERARLKSASLTIEGRHIDSLSLANLARQLNRTLVIQEANQVAIINGEDLVLTWLYSGYCRAANEAAVELNIGMDNQIPFNRLDCVAYDLRNDPQRMHRIRPVLRGSDGISKKIAVPLLERLSAGDPFSVVFKCRLPGCMKGGVDYYTSTASVSQERIPNYAVRLVFLRDRPEWVRVYECDASGTTKLLKDLRPSHETSQRTEYLDAADDFPAQSARIYLFRRADFIRAKKRKSPGRAAVIA
jgi:hypothetical protein